MESLDKLKEKIISSPYLKESDLSIILLHYVGQVELEFEAYKKKSVSWSVEDFEWRAKDVHGADWEQYFDKDLFEEALIAMIHQHQADIGINWETIDIYLDNCKK